MNLLMNKKHFLLILLLSFISIKEVNAIGFQQRGLYGDNNGIACYGSDYTYYGTSQSDGNPKGKCANGSRMWLKKTCDGTGTPVYCADDSRAMANNCEISFSEVSNWTNGTIKCNYIYEENGEAKTGTGSCKYLLGYVVNKAREKGNSFEADNYWAQLSVWGFLAKYTTSDSFSATNSNFSNVQSKNTTAASIFKEAMQEYHNKIVLGNGAVTYRETDSFTVENTGSNKLEYEVSCGVKEYKSKDIIVTNNENIKLYVDIAIENSSSNNNISICIKNQTGNEYTCEKTNSKTLEMPANTKSTFYIKSSSNMNASFNLKLSSSWDEVTGNTLPETVISSKLYARSDGNNKYQRMILPSTETIYKTETVRHTDSETITFSQESYTHKDCNISTNTDNSNIKTTSCPNITGNDTAASYHGCTCQVLELDDGSKVRVLVTEKTKFNYGHLVYNLTENDTSKTATAGLGFRLVNAEEKANGKGITTRYNSTIEWDYADYKGGVPYIKFATASKENITYQIYNKLKNNIKNEIKLIFNPINSNATAPFNDEDRKEYKLKINLDEQIVSSDYKKITISKDPIEFSEKVSFELDGTVIYGEEQVGSLVEGQKYYYIPMRYTGDFDFNTTGDNFVNSYTNEDYQFKYEGLCEIPVNDRYSPPDIPEGDPDVSVLRYRPIDVNKPFPKSVPLNWNTNLVEYTRRLAQTYEQKPTYDITLDSDTIKKLREINKTTAYSSWDTMDNTNGNNNFLTDIGMNSEFEAKGFCSVGEFNADCDKDR